MLDMENGLEPDTISDSSSDNSDNCLICFDSVQLDEYCKIDHPGESKPMYHQVCLEKWLNENRKGLFTNDTISKYNIYKNGQLFQTVLLKSYEPDNRGDVIIDIPRNVDNSYDYYDRNSLCTARNACGCLCVFLIIYIIFYFLKI